MVVISIFFSLDLNKIREEDEIENEEEEEPVKNKENTPLPALQNKKTFTTHKYFCPALRFSTNRKVEIRWENLKELLTGPYSLSKITTPVIVGRKTPDVNSGASRCMNILLFIYIKRVLRKDNTIKP